MSNASHRKRGGTFHLDDLDSNEESDHNVQFVTPYYEDPAMPEPLDLSKLCLDDDLFEKEDEDAAEKAMEDMQTRGRSRSRSVHENDLAAVNYIPTEIVSSVMEHGDHGKKNGAAAGAGNGQQGSNSPIPSDEKANRRGGPLQQREVQALKKGLEEANQSINRNQNREDEEERMAADAEKRKRLLLSNNNIANNNAATATRRVKLLMLGDSGVGKSSLICRWTLDTFSPSLVSTVGVNFKSRKVNIAHEAVQVQVWDTAGQEQFHKITTSYYKGAQGIMLVYDVTDPASLANIEYWIKNIKSHASDTVQVALIGNKTDLRAAASADPTKKCCETERGEEIAHKFGIPFFETSAKESSNVEIAFLTLVEHIMESGGGGSVTGHSPPGHSGLGHQAGQPAPSTSSTTTGGGLSAARSIVEKAGEKARMFGAFKRQPSGQNTKGTVPPPPAATNGTTPGASAAAGAGAAGAEAATGDEKEKCIIS